MNVIAMTSVWGAVTASVLGLLLTVRYKMKINAMDRRLGQKDYLGAILMSRALNQPERWVVRRRTPTAGETTSVCRCLPQQRQRSDVMPADGTLASEPSR